MNGATITVLTGPSGSGKSTYARELVDADPKRNTVRLNRDDIRSMLHISKAGRGVERIVTDTQELMAGAFLEEGYNVIIDDTNLNPKTVAKWRCIAQRDSAEFSIHDMDVPLYECIRRDNLREGKSHVGRTVIERQFLASGRLKYLAGGPRMPIAIVDIDGTLAQNTVYRSPYDESKVHLDPVYEGVAQWVRDLYFGRVCEGNPQGEAHTILLVSGRHSTCGDATVKWLEDNNIPFDHIFMRHGWDSRPDTVVKLEILDELLLNVEKEQVAFVIDDRPSVLNMWFDCGLKIYPARQVQKPF